LGGHDRPVRFQNLAGRFAQLTGEGDFEQTTEDWRKLILEAARTGKGLIAVYEI